MCQNPLPLIRADRGGQPVIRILSACAVILLACMWVNAQDVLELTIQDAVSTALTHNELLKAERYEVKEAETFRTEALAAFFPRVDAGLIRLLNEKPMVVEFPSMLEDGSSSQVEMSFARDYTLSLQLNQPLFTGGQVYYNWRVAGENLALSTLAFAKQKQALIFDVKSAYYLCIVLAEIRRVVKEGIALSRKHFERVDAFYKAGNATYQEWLRAKVQLANLEPDLHQADNDYKNAIKGLQLLLGVDKEIQLTTRLDLDPACAIEERAYRQNIAANYDVRRLEQAIAIADLQKKLAWGDYLPKLSLTVDYGLGADTFSFHSGVWDENYSISLNIQLTLFDGFARRARRKRAEYNRKGLEHQALFLQKQIANELDRVLGEVETARKKAEAYKGNLADAAESVRVSKLYYDEGLLTSFEVNAANLDYTEAKVRYLNAIHDYYIAVFTLEMLIPEIAK